MSSPFDRRLAIQHDGAEHLAVASFRELDEQPQLLPAVGWLDLRASGLGHAEPTAQTRLPTQASEGVDRAMVSCAPAFIAERGPGPVVGRLGMRHRPRSSTIDPPWADGPAAE